MSERRHGHYFATVPRREIDLYRVFKAFGVDDPAIQEAVKKLMFAGRRGVKTKRQDIVEAIEAATRCLDMLTEEEFPE